MSVITKKNGGKELYYNIYYNGVQHKKYLSRKRDAEIIELLQKKHDEYSGIKNELLCLDRLYKSLLPTAQKILSEINVIPKKYPLSPSENPSHPEWLKYITSRGEKVRSMSERSIADILFKYSIDYRYEKALQLSGVTIHPDFTIISPLSGTVYYWEHNGLDSEEYKRNWHNKLALYAENGISREKNLIVTTKEDINSIEAIVCEYFTMERYKLITG